MICGCACNPFISEEEEAAWRESMQCNVQYDAISNEAKCGGFCNPGEKCVKVEGKDAFTCECVKTNMTANTTVTLDCYYNTYTKKCMGDCPEGLICIEENLQKCKCGTTTTTIVVIEKVVETNITIKEINFTVESIAASSTTTSKATTTTKTVRTPKCGDGFIDPPEKCDPKAKPTGCKTSEKCCPEECKCYPL